MNICQLIGNLGADPDIYHTGYGKLAVFSLATNERWTDKETGEVKEQVDWHRVVISGDGIVDKVVGPYLKKGSKIGIVGKIRQRSWEKDGQKKYVTEVWVKGASGRLELLDGPKGDRPGDAPPPTGDDLDDEIPF